MGDAKAKKGKGVALRRIRKSDAPHLHRWLNDRRVSEWLALPSAPPMEEAERWAQVLATSPIHVGFGVELPGQPAPIGIVTLHGINAHHGTAETGTVLGDVDKWGRGLGTEAKVMLLDMAFDKLGLSVIESHILSGDRAGIALAKKCGYVEAGRVPGWYRREDGSRADKVILYLTKESWRSNRPRLAQK